MDLIHEHSVSAVCDGRGSSPGMEELGVSGIQRSNCFAACVSSALTLPGANADTDRIYTGRLSVETYYNYRIANQQKQVSYLQKQRDRTIAKLKAATKYDSTQQLLEKYGGTPAKPKQKGQENRKSKQDPQKNEQQPQRTGYGPPPTANILGRHPAGPAPGSPQRTNQPFAPDTPTPISTSNMPSQMLQASPQSSSAEFAPNAFPAQYYSQPEGPKWYDRFMDVLLGEDESNPKNRLALICQSCRLVNGQAPPGVKQLEDVGKWRCSGCGTMNGEISEAKKLMAKIQKEAQANAGPEAEVPDTAVEEEEDRTVDGKHESDSSDVTQYTDDEGTDEGDIQPSIEKEEPVEEPSNPKRGRPKGSTKKKS